MTPAFLDTGDLRVDAASSPTVSKGVLGALAAGYAALLPYQFEIGNRINFSPADPLLLLAFVLALGRLKYCQPAWSVWHFAIALTFVMGSLVAALRVGAVDSFELLHKDAGLLLPVLSYVVFTSYIGGWDDVRRILRVFVLGVVVENTVAVAVFLMAYFFHVADPFARYGLRLSGTMLDPNAYGGLLAAALVVCEGASWGRDPLFSGWLLWFSRVTLSLGLLFSFSRSAWVAVGLGFLLLGFIRFRLALRFLAATVIGAPCLFLIMGHRFVPIFEVMASRPQQVEGRFELIRDAFEAFRQHPVFGGGIGSFRLSEGEVAHNSAMWFLADFGVVGLAVFVGFVAWFFAKGSFAYRFAPERQQPLALGLLAGHAAMLGLAMGIEAFYQRHWWLVFALIAASYALVRRRVDALSPVWGVWR
jgi:O-antigen ligase